MTRNTFLTVFAAAILSASLFGADSKPNTVLHVITIQWKSGTTPAQIDKVLRAAEALPAQYPGILRVWTKPIKKQLPDGYTHIIVMEFANEDALKKYADSPAQKKWYEVYMPVREESRTHDITN